MLDQLVYLVAGATVIAALGRWSKQNKLTVLVLCAIWGGIVGKLHS